METSLLWSNRLKPKLRGANLWKSKSWRSGDSFFCIAATSPPLPPPPPLPQEIWYIKTTGRPGHFMENFQIPGKIRRDGRYVWATQALFMCWLKLNMSDLIVSKLCQSCHLLNWSNLVEHMKSSMFELGLKFLFRVTYFTDGKKYPSQACREGCEGCAFTPPSPPPHRHQRSTFLLISDLKWSEIGVLFYSKLLIL